MGYNTYAVNTLRDLCLYVCTVELYVANFRMLLTDLQQVHVTCLLYRNYVDTQKQ